MSDAIVVHRGGAPLIVSIPHAGVEIPAGIQPLLVSPWLARKDTDWWVDKLYDFAVERGATVVQARFSRTVIDVNRDPAGASLYPGQATTGLCPSTTFDGEPLYVGGAEPGEAEIAIRRTRYFNPYHAALVAEIGRLRQMHACVVLYDAHSIRSRVPRLFEGLLPNFCIGTNDGASCYPGLVEAVERACDAEGFTRVTNGRFKGGWITRHYGRPATGVQALQMELAFRGYLTEPPGKPEPGSWPPPYDPGKAAAMRAALDRILRTSREFAEYSSRRK